MITLKHLSKSYDGDKYAVNDISLTIPAGRITALLGPSGCGKTTILKMIAGLLPPSAGDILFDGASVLKRPSEKRGAVMVFQNHLLFPYMSVGDNVGFGLNMRGVDKSIVQKRTAEMLELVELPNMEKRKPHELSGGQQQRVALARALIVQPQALLLDEPLSSLDAHLRDKMRELIYTIQRRLAVTTIFVTHDQEEAASLADEVVLLFAGKVAQIGQPSDFYKRPFTPQVARFFGGVNFIDGQKAGTLVKTAVSTFHIPPSALPDGEVLLTIRPENMQLRPDSDGNGENELRGTVQRLVYAGTHTRLWLDVGEKRPLEIMTDAIAHEQCTVGETAVIHLPPSHIWLFEKGGE